MHNDYIKFSALIVSSLLSMTACAESVEKFDSSECGTLSSEILQSDTTEADTEPETQVPTEPLIMPEDYHVNDSCRLKVETILQNPELPTGCEVTALATVLNYYGFEIEKVELCDKFLPIEYDIRYTFDEVYIGNPKSPDGYGCNAPVIVKTAEDYFDSVDAQWDAMDLTGSDFQDLFYQIEKGRPVVIWASMGLSDVYMSLRWTTESGKEAWFAELEHCMVLTGFDKSNGIVYAADPLKGDMEYSLERFESVYEQLGKQAVIIFEQES